MKNKLFRAGVALGLTACMAFGSILPGGTMQVKAASDDGVEAFVSRMYTVALGREAEEAGLKDWSSQLENKTNDGAGIAHGFIMSEEFQQKGLGNDDYVTTLYRTFFDREPDEGGYNNWMSELNGGTGRGEVLAGFTNSTEFSNLCEKFGILRGYMYSNGDAANAGIGQFVYRLYSKALNREGEATGINDWTMQIAIKSKTAEEVATDGFFHSTEFQQRNLGDSDFLDVLYATFFDREADAAGKAQWLLKLKTGTSRDEVIQGFSRSTEFHNLLVKYGLAEDNGDSTQPTATPEPTASSQPATTPLPNTGEVYTLAEGIPENEYLYEMNTVASYYPCYGEEDRKVGVTCKPDVVNVDRRDIYGITFRECYDGANDKIQPVVEEYIRNHPTGNVATLGNRMMIISSKTVIIDTKNGGGDRYRFEYVDGNPDYMLCIFVSRYVTFNNSRQDQEINDMLAEIDSMELFTK